MTTSDDLIDRCLTAIARAQDDATRIDVVSGNRRELIGNPETVRRLVERAIALDAPYPAHPVLQLLERCLDEARMDVNGGGSYGRTFLAAAQTAVTESVQRNQVNFQVATTLGAAFRRADCAVPDALQTVDGPEPESTAASAPAEIAELLDQMEAATEGDAFQLYHGLHQTMGVLPPAGQRILLQLMTARGERLHQHLGLYWLFDPDPGLRLEAARALGGIVDSLETDFATWLPRLCRLLPDDEARQHLTAMTADRPAAADPAPPKQPVSAWATLPDGAGTQMVTVAAGPEAERTVCLAMLRAGSGVDDAFTTHDDDGQADMLDSLGQMDARAISLASARTLIMAAATENLRNGAPPPPGFIDMLMTAGFSDLALPASEVDWLATMQAAEEIAGLTKQKRGRLINASEHWSIDHPLIAHWFEGPANLPELSLSAPIARQERQVWACLEARRAWWRELMLRAAFVLQANGDPDWRSLAATAQALEDGRALKKIPIMHEIVATSLDALEAETGDGPNAGSGIADPQTGEAGPYTSRQPSWLADAGIEIVEAEPPSADEVPALLAAAGRPADPAWLDGYVMAVAAAPKPPAMNSWTSTLAAPVKRARDPDVHERFLDLLLDREAAITEAAGDPTEVQAWLQGFEAEAYAAWAAGFTAAVTEHAAAWPSKRLHPDDRRMLDDLGTVAEGQRGVFTPRVVASWLAARLAGRR